jgi:membrane fusion protein, multidrug efflux system
MWLIMMKNILEFFKEKKNARPIIIILTGLSFLMIFKPRNNPDYKNLAIVSIETAKVKEKDISVYLSTLGTVTALESANILSQVNGQIIKIHFNDGQLVKKGDLLAQIDSRPYKAVLTQYEGQLKRDVSLLENAKIDLKRYNELWQQNSIAKQTLDTQKALVEQYEGNVQMDYGLVENAKVNLSYCDIKAPIDGKIGIRLQTQGNIMQANITQLAVINSYNPIAIMFSLPEVEIAQIPKKHDDVLVEAYNHNTQKFIASGSLLAVDNQVDLATGTVKLKAKFDNANNLFFPNQFVDVKIRVKQLERGLTIPLSALQYNKKSNFVYLVDGDIAKINPVEVEYFNDQDVVIKSGLDVDQQVAISGVDKLVDGSKVKANLREAVQ